MAQPYIRLTREDGVTTVTAHVAMGNATTRIRTAKIENPTKAEELNLILGVVNEVRHSYRKAGMYNESE